jgi:Ser/Thr protein kinase RdoA (MazF antagonist)
MPNRLTGDDSSLPDSLKVIVEQVMSRVTNTVEALLVRSGSQPIHTDPHNWNMKWYRGRLSLFDFDDSGIGPTLFDLAISTYYLRPNNANAVALLEGYAEVSELPPHSADEFEALVAHRNVLLLNDLLTTLHSGHRGLLPRYIANTEIKLRSFLDSGVYRHDVDGVVPLEG